MGYLCACFELSNTARRLLFALREKYAQFGGPAVAGEALEPAGAVFDPRAGLALRPRSVALNREPDRTIEGIQKDQRMPIVGGHRL
jgi:hypothetical protein